MGTIDNLALGFSVALSLSNVLYCLFGVTLGTFIGVLPGVGPLVTIAVLLPLTFGLPIESSLIMLAGIYYGAAYGGSTTAILVNLPGETSSAMTTLDGYQMAKQGRAGPALAIAAIGSFVAGTIGTLLIVGVGPAIASMALKFGSVEYFSLMVMALTATSALLSRSVLKGIAMTILGVILGLVGTDIGSGALRLTLGLPNVIEGIDFALICIGLFAFSDIIFNFANPEQRGNVGSKIYGLMPTAKDIKQSWGAILRGTGIGSVLGILPGTGQAISAFAAYVVEKRLSRDPSRFGKGAIEGVAAPESANNASSQTTFIPTLVLGIPGSPTMALMLGALMIGGIRPGPEMMTEQPRLFWGLIASMWIGNLFLLVVNLPLIGIWVSMLKIPYRLLAPAILMFSCIGIYTLGFNVADIALAALFGVLGYVFIKLDCDPAPLILGFVLGPMLEENLRRSMVISRGDPSVFITRPISALFLLVATAILVALMMSAIRRRGQSIA